MPNFSLSCDVDQGFNFRKDRSTPVGFVTALKVGGKSLNADLKCKDPLNPGTDLAVVAVLHAVNWGVGITDTMYFSGQISTDNRQEIQMLAYLELTNVEVDFKFRTYDYDQKAKKYFQCFHCGDTEIYGLLEKRGDDLNIRVADDPSTEVQSPLNFAFQIGIKPQPKSQAITLATADQKNVIKSWGLQVA